MKKWLLVSLLVIFGGVLLTGCGEGGNNAEPLTDEPEEYAGAVTVYKARCMSCHGRKLEGKMGGRSNLQKVGSTLTTEQIAAQIEKGGKGMPAFNKTLTTEEIDALADWLSTKQ